MRAYYALAEHERLGDFCLHSRAVEDRRNDDIRTPVPACDVVHGAHYLDGAGLFQTLLHPFQTMAHRVGLDSQARRHFIRIPGDTCLVGIEGATDEKGELLIEGAF